MFKYLCFFIILAFSISGFCEPNTPPTDHIDVNDSDLQGNYLDDFYMQYELILSKYVNEKGLVNYPKLRRYRLELIPQVLEFSSLSADEFQEWSKEQRKCFWINAYNFYVLKSVIENYPINPPFYKKIWWPENSVVHIDGFYDKNYVVVMGLEYTLNELAEIAVNEFGDPNVCFALTDATLGAPPLAQKPYRAEIFDEMIKKQIDKQLSRDVGFELDLNENKLVLAELFDKYSEAFIKKYGDMKKFRAFDDKVQAAFNFLDNNASKDIVDELGNITTDFEISFKRRNWRYFVNLNEVGVR